MNNRYSIFLYLVQFISMQGMEHPQRLIIANRKRHKITDIETRLHKLPTDEINIFTFTPLKDSLMCKNHRIVQVVCGDFYGNVKAISYYPENEFVQWYFKENAIEQVFRVRSSVK
ncbi:MAG: hypothetical protein BWY54_00391 [Candidatus Dependentiae bacterium ADurb.Bin331]|nr:MAG: hypothetical protein BWY54_00391 [Candidatus Dependentiae bacterium ADurb.Bin331]